MENKNNINAKNKRGDTVLHLAVENGKSKLTHFLIENGADINLKNNLGKTALQIAIHMQRFEIAEFLQVSEKTILETA